MRRPRARMARHTARPSRPGRPTSRMTASGGLASAASRPVGPSPATVTRKPSSAENLGDEPGERGLVFDDEDGRRPAAPVPGTAGRGHERAERVCTFQ